MHLKSEPYIVQEIPTKFIRMILKSTTLQDCKIIYPNVALQKKWTQKGVRNQRYTFLSD